MHRRSFVPVYDPEYYDSNEEFTSHNFTYSDYLMPKRREKRGVSPVFLVNDDFEPTYAIEYYDDIELLDMTKDDYMIPKHGLIHLRPKTDVCKNRSGSMHNFLSFFENIRSENCEAYISILIELVHKLVFYLDQVLH